MIKVKKLILLTVSFFTPLLFCETYSYEIEEVESVDVSSGVEFTVWCGAVNKLKITADSEDDFRMSLKDKKLKITRKNSDFWLFFPWGSNDVTADITWGKYWTRHVCETEFVDGCEESESYNDPYKKVDSDEKIVCCGY